MMPGVGGVRRFGREVALFALGAAVAATGWTVWLAVPVTVAGFWQWNLVGAGVIGVGVGSLVVRARAVSGPLAGVAFGTAWAATAAWRAGPEWTSSTTWRTALASPDGDNLRDALGWTGTSLTPGKTGVVALTVLAVLATATAARLLGSLAAHRRS
ncbi:hypothetical protein GCM10027589_05180 [Actinocorallia lasiicapitis]